MTHEFIWPFWWGGLAIAGVSILLVFTTGRFLSVTRGYASVCSVFSKLNYFKRPDLGGAFGFRTMFSLGLILGGAVAAVTTVGYNPTFDLGVFNQIWGSELWVKAVVLISGGILWGFGARMAKGCTAGNSISGLSQASFPSLVTTVGFLIAGVVVTFALSLISGVK